jgi:hypothetical protein
MESYFAYVIVGILVCGLVLLETWIEYRKMDYFDPNRDEVMLKGVSNSIIYGTFWPSTLIFFVLGKLIATPRGK